MPNKSPQMNGLWSFMLLSAWFLGISSTALSDPRSYLVEGPGARDHVDEVGGVVTRDLAAVNMVVARLEPTQAGSLTGFGLRVVEDRAVQTAAVSNQAYPTPIPGESGASALHARGIYGSGVTIAFVDTGVWRTDATRYGVNGKSERIVAEYDATVPDKSNPGLQPGLRYGAPLGDRGGHGTHVTSIATSSLMNKTTATYEGVAPDAGVVAVRAFDSFGAGTYESVVTAINWVIANRTAFNIRVLNLSFSADPQSWYWDDPIARAVMSAWQSGIVVVAAGGNRGPMPMSIGVPGNVPYVITVGAYTDSFTPVVAGDPIDRSDDRLAPFSSVGPTYEGFVKPEVIALGGHVVGEMETSSDLYRAYSQNGAITGVPHHFMMSGTSQSAAVVSGVVALMLQADGSLTPDDVKCRLMASAAAAQNANGDLIYSIFQQGAGAIDATAAVASTERGCANRGLDVAADLAGTAHFGGPANMDDNGNYYLMSSNGGAANQGMLWVPSTKPGTQGMLWVPSTKPVTQGMLWVPSTKPTTAGYFGDALDWGTGLWQGALIPSGFTWSRSPGVLVSGQISNHPFWVPQQ